MNKGKFEISVDSRHDSLTAELIEFALTEYGYRGVSVEEIVMLSADGHPINIGDDIWVAHDVQGYPPTRHKVARFEGVKIFYADPDQPVGCHKRVAFKSLAAALRDALNKLEGEESTPTASSSETPSAASQ